MSQLTMCDRCEQITTSSHEQMFHVTISRSKLDSQHHLDLCSSCNDAFQRFVARGADDNDDATPMITLRARKPLFDRHPPTKGHHA